MDPRYLPTLRNCNIKYRAAVHIFKQNKWEAARKKYDEYLKINLLDWSAYAELAMCYFKLAMEKHEKNDLEYKRYYRKSVSYIDKAVKHRPKNNRFAGWQKEIKSRKKILGAN